MSRNYTGNPVFHARAEKASYIGTGTSAARRGRTVLFAAGGLAALLVPVLAGPPAMAQTRRQPDTTQLTCARTQELIGRFGAINLKSGPHRFDRYVADRSKCLPGQSVRTVFVPTSDQPRCGAQICSDPDRNRR